MTEVLTRRRCPVCGLDCAGELPGFCARPSCGVELVPDAEDRPRVRTFGLVDHFSLCVLPFSFAEPVGVPLRLRLTRTGRWRERIFSAADPEDVDRTEYFLPYIRRFLFPSLYGSAGPARSCWHYVFDLARLGPVGRGGLDLTLRVHDVRKDLERTYPLALEQIELLLFSYRVGFLVLHFGHRERGVTYFEQMEALASLRTIAPLYRGFEMPELTAGGRSYRMTDLLAYLLAEVGGTPAPQAPGETSRASLPIRPIHDDRMMVYAFSCLNRRTVLTDVARCEALLRRGSVINLEPASTTRPQDGVREQGLGGWLQSRWRGFSKDGGVLVVFDTDRFHARFLGVYQRTYYFDVFLLAALQRVTLLTLFENFSDSGALITGSSASRKLLRRVRRDLLLFKSQC
jgi:hypothetical protein